MTPEDRDIWVGVGLWGPFVLNSALEAVSMFSDRADADRMCLAQDIARHGPSAIELHGVAYRGWDQL